MLSIKIRASVRDSEIVSTYALLRGSPSLNLGPNMVRKTGEAVMTIFDDT